MKLVVKNQPFSRKVCEAYKIIIIFSKSVNFSSPPAMVPWSGHNIKIVIHKATNRRFFIYT